MSGLDVVHAHRHLKLVHHREDRDQGLPELLLVGVDVLGNEHAAALQLDDLLLDELQGVVELAVQAVGAEDDHDVNRATVQPVEHRLQPLAAALASTLAAVGVDVAREDIDAVSVRPLLALADLILDALLEPGTEPGIDDTAQATLGHGQHRRGGREKHPVVIRRPTVQPVAGVGFVPDLSQIRTADARIDQHRPAPTVVQFNSVMPSDSHRIGVRQGLTRNGLRESPSPLIHAARRKP
ncbi:MAG: hypothetical protein QM770_14320 [Tepidisphaeraceae bacterium]